MKRKLKHNIVENNVDEFLKTFILMWDAMYFKSNITKTEVRFLIDVLKLHRKGIDINSRDATIMLRDCFTTADRERSVHTYRGKLKDKHWIIQTTETLVLNPILRGNFDSLVFNINLKYES